MAPDSVNMVTHSPACLGMLNIGLLNILQINCYTIGTKKEVKDKNYKNKRDTINMGSEQCYADTGPEKKYNKKDDSADYSTNKGSSLKSNNRLCNASLPTVKDSIVNYSLSGMTNNEPLTIEKNNEIEYFLPGPNKGNNKKASATITKQI